jgi:hypothetical protein
MQLLNKRSPKDRRFREGALAMTRNSEQGAEDFAVTFPEQCR